MISQSPNSDMLESVSIIIASVNTAEEVSTIEFVQSLVNLTIHWKDEPESTVLLDTRFLIQLNSW